MSDLTTNSLGATPDKPCATTIWGLGLCDLQDIKSWQAQLGVVKDAIAGERPGFKTWVEGLEKGTPEYATAQAIIVRLIRWQTDIAGEEEKFYATGIGSHSVSPKLAEMVREGAAIYESMRTRSVVNPTPGKRRFPWGAVVAGLAVVGVVGAYYWSSDA